MANLISPATYSFIVKTAMCQNQTPSDEEVADFNNLVGITPIRDAANELAKKDASFGNQASDTTGYTLARCAVSVTKADNELYPVNQIYTAMDATEYDTTTGKVTDDTPTRVFSTVLEANKFMATLSALSVPESHEPIDQALWEPFTFTLTAADLSSTSRMLYYYYVTAPAAVETNPNSSVVAELKAAYVTATTADSDLPEPNWHTTDATITDEEKEAIIRFIALVGTNGDTIAASKLKEAGFPVALVAAVSDDVTVTGSLKQSYNLTATIVANTVATHGTGTLTESPSALVSLAALNALNDGTGPVSTHIAKLLALYAYGFPDEEVEAFIAANTGTYATSPVFTDLAQSRPTYFKNITLQIRLAKLRRTLKGIAPDGSLVLQTETALAVYNAIKDDVEYIQIGQPPAAPTKTFAITLLSAVAGQTVAIADLQNITLMSYIVTQVSKNNTDPEVYGAPAYSYDNFVTSDNTTATLLAKLFYVDANSNILQKIQGAAFSFSSMFNDSNVKAIIIDKLITNPAAKLAFILKDAAPGSDAAAFLLIKGLFNDGVTVSTLLAQSVGLWSRSYPVSLLLVKLFLNDHANGFGNNDKVDQFLTYVNDNVATVRSETATLTDDEKVQFIKLLIINRNKGDYANLLPMFESTPARKLALFKLVAESIDDEQVSALRGMVQNFSMDQIVDAFGAFVPAYGSGLDDAPQVAPSKAAETMIQLFTDRSGIEKLREVGVPVLYLLTHTTEKKVLNLATGTFAENPRKELLFKIAVLKQVYPVAEVDTAVQRLYSVDPPTNI